MRFCKYFGRLSVQRSAAGRAGALFDSEKQKKRERDGAVSFSLWLDRAIFISLLIIE